MQEFFAWPCSVIGNLKKTILPIWQYIYDARGYTVILFVVFIKPSLLQDRTSYIYLFQRCSIVFEMKLHAEILTVPWRSNALTNRCTIILAVVALKQLLVTALLFPLTGGPFMARTWLGEIGPCCCLPLYPGVACSIHTSLGPPFSRALYSVQLQWCHQRK